MDQRGKQNKIILYYNLYTAVAAYEYTMKYGLTLKLIPITEN